VFLDARRGTYVCLAQGAALLSIGSDGRLVVNDLAVRSKLHEAGLITAFDRSSSLAARRSPPDLPVHDAGSGHMARPSAFTDLLLAYASMMWRFRLRSFAAIVAQAEKMSDRQAAGKVSPELLADVEFFQKWLPWLPFQGECLFRCFMMLSFLQRRGHTAQWVFGVRTWPFAAHCWLQVGDTALDDHSGRLGAYTPIMAI
jgi:hypothetical protein